MTVEFHEVIIRKSHITHIFLLIHAREPIMNNHANEITDSLQLKDAWSQSSGIVGTILNLSRQNMDLDRKEKIE
jgi:hypothetical protein